MTSLSELGLCEFYQHDTTGHSSKYSRMAPGLWGYVCFPTFDQTFQLILTVRFTHDFLPALALALAIVTDLWACIVRGPPVGERSSVAKCVPKAEGRDAVLCGYFGLPGKGKIVFPHVISCLLTVERTTLATRPSSVGTGHGGHGDGGPLPSHGERGVFPTECAFSPHPEPLSLLETLAATAISCRKSWSGWAWGVNQWGLQPTSPRQHLLVFPDGGGRGRNGAAQGLSLPAPYRLGGHHPPRR
jgi:hypothetical protein